MPAVEERDDFAGATRSATAPTIGAYEYDPSKETLGVDIRIETGVLKEGSSGTAEAIVSGAGDAPVEYEWYLDGQLVSTDAKPVFENLAAGYRHLQLVVRTQGQTLGAELEKAESQAAKEANAPGGQIGAKTKDQIKKAKAKIEGEGCTDAFTIPFSASSLNLSHPHFIKLRLIEGGKEIASTFYWRSASKYEGPKTVTGPCVVGFEKLSELPPTTLKLARTTAGAKVTNTGGRIAFMVNVQAYGQDGRRIVPVHYSDNFFSLLPGEAREVSVEGRPDGAEIRAEAWNGAATDAANACQF